MTLPSINYPLMLAILGTAGLAGCAPAATQSYVQRYPEVLTVVANDDRGGPIPSGAAERFSAFFEAVPEPGVRGRVEALYAPDAYFSDTLFLTEEREALVAHFERLQRNDVRIAVIIDDAIEHDDELFLRWRMRFTFDVGGRPRESETIGMTQLRFDRDGRVRFHQDFWDSTEGFYRHLPVVGSVIRSIGARMAATTKGDSP
jgi:hypothetical protein